jgi:hypothetical protein
VTQANWRPRVGRRFPDRTPQSSVLLYPPEQRAEVLEPRRVFKRRWPNRIRGSYWYDPLTIQMPPARLE